MTKPITPGELLAKVMAEQNVSIRQLAKRLHLPPTRVEVMLLNTRGFEPITLTRFANVIGGYGDAWWRMMNEMAKSGRLFDDRELV